MKLILEDEQQIRLEANGAGLEVVSPSPHVVFSPLHMLAGSLATCTIAVLYGWALNAGLDVTHLTIQLAWEYGGGPYRVTRFDMTLQWPDLPEERRAAALRTAAHCTVEHTLRYPPEIMVRVEN